MKYNLMKNLSIEYLDYLTILVDQQLRIQRQLERCIVQGIDSIEILNLEKEEPKIQKKDTFTILREAKAPLQTDYIDELQLEGYVKPENEEQIVEQIEIKEQERPNNEVEYIDCIELIYSIHQWITQPSDGDKLNIFRQEKPEKPENVVEERDSIDIQGKEKEQNQVEYIDELFLEEEIKPENEILKLIY